MRGRTAYILVFSVVSLLAIGIVMLQSTGAFARDSHGDMYHFVRRQGMWLCIGLVAMVGAALTDYRWWGKFWPHLYGLAVLLLVLCFVPFIGMKINGSYRWINLGFASFQPSELGKVAAIVFLAWWFHRHENETKQFLRGFAMPLAVVGVIIGLIALEVDLGASSLIGLTTLAVMFVAGASLLWLVPMMLCGLAGLVYVIMHNPERFARIGAFLDPQESRLGEGLQQWQAMVAFGAGGVLLPGQMDDLQIEPGESAGRFGHEAVDTRRALTAPHDEQGAAIGIQSECAARFGFGGNVPGQFAADGRSGDTDFAPGKVAPALFESEEDFAAEPRPEAVGFAGDGVRVVEKSGNAAAPRRRHGRNAGETAHAEDGVGPELRADRTAFAVTGEESRDKFQRRRREQRGQTDRGQGFARHVGKRTQSARVDFFFRDQQHHIVAAAAQFFGHRKSGEQMPASSPACDDELHQKRTARLVAGTALVRGLGARRPWRWMLSRMPTSIMVTARLLPP